MKKPILYYHMPKTCGGYMQKVLQNSGLTLRGVGEKDFVKPGMDVYQSHYHYEKGRTPDSDPDAFHMTFLRNPVSMVYSSYHYFKKTKLPGTIPPMRIASIVEPAAAAADLDDYVENNWPLYPKGWWPEDLSAFDFVGVAEDMETSLKALGRCLGMEIKLCEDMFNVGKYDKDHRPREIELGALFVDELTDWNKAKENLNNY